MVYCSECGKKNEDDAEYCSKCGASLTGSVKDYKKDKEEVCLGFIAEDVPELVASKDRKGMSPMDVVAVLTKVVQEQQRRDKEQQSIISELQKRLAELEKKTEIAK